MKEFIDKLIERLEEESRKWLDVWDENRYDSYADGMNDAFDEAIEIVNQLAKDNLQTIDVSELFEGGNDFCDWKSEKDMFIQNPHTSRKFNNEPSMKNVYCNTCGKKIKVVE